MRIISTTAAAGAVALLCSTSASAAEGLKDAICAVQQAIICEAYAPCERALPGSLNLPALLRIHKDQKTVEARRDSGAVRTSAIDTVTVTDEVVILQGQDDLTPWAVRIDQTTGRMVMTVARDKQAYTGFGVCSAAILGQPS